MDFVLLTAAITPAAQFNSALADPSVRLKQYQKAVAVWADRTAKLGWQVVIVETTGCPASLITSQVDSSMRNRVTVVPYDPEIELMSRGKGSVEAAAIDYALGPSALDICDSSTFYKATGRLVIKNTETVLHRIPSNTATVRRSLDGKYCDTRFFGTTVGFWNNNLGGMAAEVDDEAGRYIEHVLAQRLRISEYSKRSLVSRFTRRPIIEGQSGTTGARYGRFGSLSRGAVLQPVETFLADRFSSKQI